MQYCHQTSPKVPTIQCRALNLQIHGKYVSIPPKRVYGAIDRASEYGTTGHWLKTVSLSFLLCLTIYISLLLPIPISLSFHVSLFLCPSLSPSLCILLSTYHYFSPSIPLSPSLNIPFFLYLIISL